MLEIGEEVNGETKSNLCTSEEEVKEQVECVGPTSYTAGPGSFNFELKFDDLLAMDHEGWLYVGDEHRAQEFEAEGKWMFAK